MTLYIAICDDDKYAINNESKLIRDVLEEKQIVYHVDTFNSPRELLKSNTKYNIVFLDIKMDQINGIETAERIRSFNKDCLFFFVTNYRKYLDEALNQHAFRFWTKPIDRRRLISGIDSALKEIRRENQFIYINARSSDVKLYIDNIIYMYVQNRKTHIFTTKGEIIISAAYQTVFNQLKEYENFFETHRSYCVNLNYITGFDKYKIYCSYDKKNYEIYLSRRKYEEFQKKIVRWIGE